MIALSLEWRRAAAIRAPLGRELHRPDTRVIERAGWYQVITPSAPRGMLNEVVLSTLREVDVERVVDETIAEYRRVGQATKWCVGPWTRPTGFAAHLLRRGFTSWDVRGMGRATNLDLGPAPGVRVDEIAESTLEAYLTTTMVGWNRSSDRRVSERDAHRVALSSSSRSAWFFGAYLDGRMVGTAAIFGREGYGYLVGGVVLPEARGRGVYRALVSARLAFLRARATPYAVAQAREATSAPMLGHLGFETLFRSTCWRLDEPVTTEAPLLRTTDR